jgi:GT2 family glycosyltransferase
MDASPAVSVVIPAHNRCDSLLALLADVDRQKDVEFEVIVADDGSIFDPTKQIQNAFPRAAVLRSEVNRGPAAARNRGILSARGRIVVGFDSDVTVPDPTVLRRVVDLFDAHPAVQGIAFRLFQPDARTDDTPRWWHPVPLSRFAGRRFFTSYFSGTAYAFRRDALVAAGLFPEIYFMHYEEVELAYRVLDRGGMILYAPELAVVHHAHPVSRRSEIRMFYKPRNQLLLAAGCLPPFRALRYVAPRLVYQFMLAVKNGHLAGFLRALRSAGAKLPERLQSRRVLRSATFQRLSLLRQGVSA